MTIVKKRNFPRILLNVKVEYDAFKGSPRGAGETRSKNVSADGICLTIPEKIDIGDVLRLKLSLQGENDFIIVTGKVVWVQGFSITQTIFNHASHYKDYDCGIEFVDVDPKDQKKISRYLKLPSLG
ncbi:MAG: PilZ domain-containing protein [Syntrophales bacterium]